MQEPLHNHVGLKPVSIQSWLLTKPKQEASISIAATLSRLFLQIEDTTDQLMRFMPEPYLDITLEMVSGIMVVHHKYSSVQTRVSLTQLVHNVSNLQLHSTRRSEMRLWSSVEEYEGAGLDSVIAATVALSGDARIIHPEARSLLLGTIWVLLQEAVCVIILSTFLVLFCMILCQSRCEVNKYKS